jgi:uncharacterized protein (DUF2141 family)
MKANMMAAALAAAMLAAGAAQAGDVTVQLTGAHGGGGKVYATLYNRETFMRAGGQQAMVDPASGAVTVTFHDVPAGDYAFMAFHDENGDGQMGRSPTGMPSEGWAMSNADQLMGPPTFDVLKFAVPASGATLSTPLIYSSGQ